MTVVGVILLVVGYPVAVVMVTRLVPILRQRRWRWFVALEAATACIIVGFAVLGEPLGAVLNGAAFAGFAFSWWGRGRRAPVPALSSSGGDGGENGAAPEA
ncbi:hypothetical protein BH18ACT4_BH18ACT4_05860 [soil metagenome]